MKKLDDRQKQVGEIGEVLDAIGHENEKEGIKWTQYFMDIWDKKELENQHRKKHKLKKSLGFTKREYYRIISNMIDEELRELDIPPGYVAWSSFDEKGVVLRLTTYNGEKYNRAFKPDGSPSTDFNVVVGLLIDTQDTIDRCENKRRENLNKMGLII